MNTPGKNNSIISLGILFAGLACLTACGPSKQQKEDQKETVRQEGAIDTPSVQLVDVKKGIITGSITIPGELQPYLEANLYAKIASYVKTLLVDIGSQVQKGQLLAKLEAPEINSQLAEAKSRIQQNKAIYFADKATYDRLYSTSKTPGTVSPNDLEQAKAKMESDSSNVEAARSEYEEVQANLQYLDIRAPFDGVITVRNINIGAYVGPGSGSTAPLLVVEDHKHLRLVISVPENFTEALNSKGEVSFSVRELQGRKFTAKVARSSGSIDERLRAEQLEMDINNSDNALLPNMYADVTVPTPERDSSLLIPKSAMDISTEKVFVIKVVDGHAKWIDVQKGLQTKDMTEVFGDLKPGDKVVKVATDEIRDGSPVKVSQNSKDAGNAANNESATKDSTGNGSTMVKPDSGAKKKKSR
jgi:membrane fusion protein (multidrug efflux system)